jgi:hypothetical protein
MNECNVSFLFPKAVRQQVLAQHEELRSLLRAAMEQTTLVLQAGGALDELGTTVIEIRRRLRNHLAYEERVLFPVLVAIDIWGPERVAALAAEHARQRAQLDTMLEGLQSGWDEERLALVLRSLVSDILIDMVEEEEGPLDPRLLGDEMIAVPCGRD